MDSGFDFDVIQRSWVYLFREGMSFTLTLTALAMAGGIVFGTLLAMMRLSSMKPVAMLAGGYVNLMRSIPLVLVIFWFFFLVPYIGAWMIGARDPIKVGAFWSAAITFTMFEAAYYCEIMRAGIQSIPRGQVWSGYALGLDYWQTMARIVLPQAFRNMLPVLLTQTIILFQDTSLVYVISATDFLGAAANVANRDYRLVEMYSFVAVVYFVVSTARTRRRNTPRQRSCTSRLPPGRDVQLRCRGVFRRLVRAVDPGQAAPGTHRNHQVGSNDLAQERQQVVRRLPGPHRLLHRCQKRPGRRRVRTVRERKIDAHQVRERPGALPERRNHGRRHLGRRSEDRSPEAALEDRHGVPELRAVSAHERDPQPDAGAGEGASAHS